MDAHDGNTASTKSISSLEIVVSPKAKQADQLLVNGESLPAEECLDKFQIDELEDEIQDLIDDQVYTGFIVGIANEKPIDPEHYNDESDEQFIPKYVCAEKDENGKEAEDPIESYEELSSSSESETSTVIENEGDEATTQLNQDSEVCPDELELIKNNVPVAVPRSSLKKTQDLYPPFWRVKHAIRNVGENDGYKSGEDEDFLPENDVESENSSAGEDEGKPSGMNDKNDSSSMSDQSSDDEKFDHDELEQEMKGLQEMPDLKEDVKGLSEMVQEMSFVSNNVSGQDVSQNGDAYNEDMEEGNDNVGFSPINFVEAIIKFDDADYDEKTDPDYELPISDDRNASESNMDDSNEESDPDEPSKENDSNSDESNIDDPNTSHETDAV